MPLFDKLAGRVPGFLDGGEVKEFAVLAPFLPEEEAFLFQVRSRMLSRQPGEVCFPGGFIEAGETPREAALRETMEELLVGRESIEVVAPLDLLAMQDTRIYPFLAGLRGYRGGFNPGEVAEVFTVPFEFFLRTEPDVYYNRVSITPDKRFPYALLGVKSYPWRSSRYPVPFYRYGDRVIWGMTARFVHNIVKLYRELS